VRRMDARPGTDAGASPLVFAQTGALAGVSRTVSRRVAVALGGSRAAAGPGQEWTADARLCRQRRASQQRRRTQGGSRRILRDAEVALLEWKERRCRAIT